jgi:Gpi18-like mannosyltransferase
MESPTTPRRALAWGAVWLACVWVVALAANRSTPWLTGPTGWPPEISRRVTALARWDSGWYIGIAESGYEAPPTSIGQETNHAFFPLYPLLMRGVARATGLETSRAGAFISALALLLATALFARWVSGRFGQDRARPALLVFLLLPTSFFFAAVYTESLLVFLSLASVLAAEERRDLRAALAGLLAGLTRVSGLVLAPYLLLTTWRARRAAGEPQARALLHALFVGASPLAGFGLFCLYFREKFGDAFLFVRAQHNWAKESKTVFDGPTLILQTIAHDVTTGSILYKSPARTMEGVLLVLFLFLAFLLAKRRLYPEATYVFLTVAIVFASGTLESGGRYVLPAFPAFAALASLASRPRVFRVFLVLCAVTQAVYVWLFVHWLWVG